MRNLKIETLHSEKPIKKIIHTSLTKTEFYFKLKLTNNIIFLQSFFYKTKV